LGRNIHIIKKNIEASVVASKEIGLEGNADKIYVPVSRIECRMKSQYKD